MDTSLLHTPFGKKPLRCTIIDGTQIDPEALAMLQAYNSRSDKEIEDRLGGGDDVQAKAREALSTYFLNYGHKSIGQCGSTTLFLGNVPIFLAKCIQNHPLYNGQETSTRYLDFSERDFFSPLDEKYGISRYREKVLGIYKKALEEQTKHFMHELRGQSGTTSAAVVERTAKTRAFDVCRGILPAGFTTQLSWHGTFDAIRDQLLDLVTYRPAYITEWVMHIANELEVRYPYAFKDFTVKLRDRIIANKGPSFQFDHVDVSKQIAPDKGASYTDSLTWLEEYALMASGVKSPRERLYSGLDNIADLEKFRFVHESMSSPTPVEKLDIDYFLAHLGPRDTVPRNIGMYSSFLFQFTVDYGSYRDIQRHRNGLCSFPHYAHENGVVTPHTWYAKKLGVPAHPDAGENDDTALSDLLDQMPTLWQMCFEQSKGDEVAANALFMHYVPMMCLVNVRLKYDLPQCVYFVNLRTQETVHPTARSIAQDVARAVKLIHPTIRLHADMRSAKEITQSVKRGSQTIFESSDKSVAVGEKAPMAKEASPAQGEPPEVPDTRRNRHTKASRTLYIKTYPSEANTGIVLEVHESEKDAEPAMSLVSSSISWLRHDYFNSLVASLLAAYPEGFFLQHRGDSQPHLFKIPKKDQPKAQPRAKVGSK